MNKTDVINYGKDYYNTWFLALLPLIVCATFLYSPRVLLICAVASITARATDVAMSVVLKRNMDGEDRGSILAALVFSMMIPVTVPLYVVVVTVALVIMAGKYFFGGKDVYPFSLAALAMCVASVNWPDKIFAAVVPFSKVNFWTGASNNIISGSSVIKLGGLPYISSFDLLLGNHPGAIGTGFVLIIIASAIFLIATKKLSWHAPVTFIATCAVISLLFPRIYGVPRLYSLKYELLCSNIIFFAVFVMNEEATSPKNNKSKIMFGFICGLVSMFFRYFGQYEIGCCFALLIVNATSGFWDRLFESGDMTVKKRFEGVFTVVNKEYKELENKVVKNKTIKEIKDNNLDEENKETIKNNQNSSSKNKTKKSKNNKAKKSNKNDDMSATKTLDIISKAEDYIDEVEFSTQTIDMKEALKSYEEKCGKEEK